MELGEEHNFDLEERNADPLNYHLSDISSDWELRAANHSNQSAGLISMKNDIAPAEGDPVGTSVDSYRLNLWSHQNSSNNTGDNKIALNIVASGKEVSSTLRAGMSEELGLSWNMPKRNDFLQTAGEVMPQTLSEFPADAAFIERAAKFSCFNGGSFTDMVKHFNISEAMNPFSKDGMAVQDPTEVHSTDVLRPAVALETGINVQNTTEGSHDVVGPTEQGANDGSLIREREVLGYLKPHDETSKDHNVPYDAEVCANGCQVASPTLEAPGLPSAFKGHTVKKRKRIGQANEIGRHESTPHLQCETAKDDSDPKKQNGQNQPITSKATKHGKDSSQNSDAAKEDYIHVRARRGQATNSHSLAERVRREKISERMKYLQDLVPGCNKVTGKAVMLDEIINYVQSLQRQVEFLSMKLATVNPRLDINIEDVLAKDIHQSRGCPSSFPFSSDANMVHAQLHPSQQSLIPSGIPGTGNPLNAHRRQINSMMAMNGVYKDPSQTPNMWDDDLNNVFQMNFGTNASFNGEDLTGSLSSGHMKRHF